ncbi:MAG: cell division protein FtsA [Gammaproteobacteria bacterium]|nr:cell division protein FtsA [Gammaproteobacteria bacterium]
MNNSYNNEKFVALDIGTTKVLCLVAEYSPEGKLRIIGIGDEPCSGLNKGVISEIDTTVTSIKRATDTAAGMSKFAIKSVTTGISGKHIQSYNGNGILKIINETVTEEDKETVIDKAADIQIPSDQEILHVIEQDYTIDDQKGIKEPLNMAGSQLHANVHIITASSTAKKNLAKCIENSFLTIDEYVLQPVASSYSVLTEEEKSLGVCLVDIGGGTTDIAIFTDGTIKYTSIIPLAGQSITNDIRVGLVTTLDAAEEIKKKYGSLIESPDDDQIKIPVPSVSDKPESETSKPILKHIISCRLDEIFKKIQEVILNSGYSNKIRCGIVFTGGGSKIDGLDVYAESKFGCPVKIGSPVHIDGLTNLTGKTRYATAVGLLLYRENQLEKMPHRQHPSNSILEFLNKLWEKISNYFQKEL